MVNAMQDVCVYKVDNKLICCDCQREKILR